LELIRKATVEDGRDIASRIRQADRREALAYTGVPPSILLPYAAKEPNTLVGLGPTGRPEVIFGVDPVPGTPMGMIWLMATKELEEDKVLQMTFLRSCKTQLNRFLEEYPVLGNYLDERNKLHLKWVRWLGFSILKRIPNWGVEGRPFLQIVITRKD